MRKIEGNSLAFGKHDIQTLRQHSVRGGAITIISFGARFTIQIATQVALTRLLSPQDFGILAMVSPVISFATLFNDLGLSQATIQRQQITQRELSSLFWINVALSLILCATISALSPIVGWFYSDERATRITAFLSVVLILGGLAAQHLAILNRHMSFVRLAVIDVLSAAFGCSAAIGSALFGFGYWALVVMSAGTALFTVVIAWILSGWRPSAPHVAGVGSLLRFGGGITGFNLVNFFSRNLDNVLIGRINGATSLGYYDRAYKIMLFPLAQFSAPITRVAIPLLSRLRERPENYRSAYLKMLQSIYLVAIPGVICGFAAPQQVVETLFGPEWLSVAPILYWLSLIGLLSFFGQSAAWIFISLGRTGEYFVVGLISSFVYVTAFIVGVRHGAVGVARAYSLAGIFVVMPLWWVSATRRGPIGPSDVLKALWPFLVSGAGSFGALRVLEGYFVLTGFQGLISIFLVSYATTCATLLIIPSGRGIIRQVITLRSSLWAVSDR